MRRFALAGLLIAALAPGAFANGRAPGTSTIHFRQGNEQDIAAGMTFGLLLSHDGGVTWHWMCELAVGYGGLWDPDYSYLQNGALFATTFNGLMSMSDGCSFNSTSFGTLFVSTDEAAGSTLLFGAADANDDKIYKSTDEGMTFPTSATPTGATLNDWYTSMVFAPSDATKVYAAGYRFAGPMGAQYKELLLYKSIDGGTTFTPMGVNGLPSHASGNLSNSASIQIVGVDPTTPGTVYIDVQSASGPVGDTIYKTTNGTSWTAILSKADTISFLARKNGDLVAGTRSLGAYKSSNGGATWTPLASPPQINCLAENGAGEVWACTQNYDTMNGSQTVPGDGFGIMKSTDLATWTGVLKYEDIAGPVDCATGTIQHDTCQQMNWCGVKAQLGITSTAVDCSAITVDGAPDAGSGSTDAGTGGKKDPKGCCDSGPGSAPPLLLGLVVATSLLVRRRRPKEM